MRSSDLYRASAFERPPRVEVGGSNGDGENGSSCWGGGSIARAEPQPDGVCPMRRGERRARDRGYVDVRRYGGYPFAMIRFRHPSDACSFAVRVCIAPSFAPA